MRIDTKPGLSLLYDELDKWKYTVEQTGLFEPPARQRKVDLSITDRNQVDGIWWMNYESNDPFHQHNSTIVDATTRLLDVLHASCQSAESLQPFLYSDPRRSCRGKRASPVTQAFASLDDFLRDWIWDLPNPQCLLVPASPWSDTASFSTVLGRALLGGSSHGRALREREQWQRLTARSALERGDQATTLSLGVGSLRPILDVLPNGSRSVVLGPSDDREAVTVLPGSPFHLPTIENAMCTYKPNLVDVVGLLEYMPSRYARCPSERRLLSAFQKLGRGTVEAVLTSLWKRLPPSAVILTSNMRSDTPHATFITEALGWEGLIQRTPCELARIMFASGIPSKSFELTTKPACEAGAEFTFVTITKQPVR
jgi:hypothetical protein